MSNPLATDPRTGGDCGGNDLRTGANLLGADRALVASDQAAARLAPSGFDHGEREMTPQEKVERLIVRKAIEFGAHVESPDAKDAYATLVDRDEHWDAMNEVREGEAETGLPCDWSRHYESKSVAAKAEDGSWVGWTYWYGGGKHGEPEGIDWIDSAYDLDCAEEEKVVVVRTFAKRETA